MGFGILDQVLESEFQRPEPSMAGKIFELAGGRSKLFEKQPGERRVVPKGSLIGAPGEALPLPRQLLGPRCRHGLKGGQAVSHQP